MPEYRTPGVYIEEISAGPRPVQAAATTDTAFVAILTLPEQFTAGRGLASGLFIPQAEPQVLLSWNRARAFRPLSDGAPAVAALPPPAAPEAKDGKKPDGAAPAAAPATPAKADSNRLNRLVKEMLPGAWEVLPAAGDIVALRSPDAGTLRFPANRSLLSVKPSGEWDLAWGADEAKVVDTIAGSAIQNQLLHSGNLDCLEPGAAPKKIDIAGINDRLVGPAPSIRNMTGYTQWRQELGEKIFKEIIQEALNVSPSRAVAIWEGLTGAARGAWDRWLRAHPGIQRLELALQGFFENGGSTAWLVLGIQASGAAGPNKRNTLQAALDGVGDAAMICAPGLEIGWQQAILEYAGPKGRGDMFAVLETPRYLLTREPKGVKLDNFRWSEGSAPYEIGMLETLSRSESNELRFLGFASDELLDRTIPRDDAGYGAAYGPWLIVDNPLSTGSHDRYVIAPPSGHAAGVIAATDLKAGGGVHKAPANEQMLGVVNLVTEISDREQAPLNTKSINIIRHRPGGGIRIWGARTVGADALWRYINVRRLFLLVERSIRNAVNWAVFLPNNDRTRRDLGGTIGSFLYSLWNQGMLDGASHSEAYTVKCDKENNPDVDVRSGMLTVDVMFRPVYPAEFVRIRFQQAPMQVPG